MNGWVVFFALVAAYLGAVHLIRRREGPLPGGFELHGPLLFWRTQFGKRTLERIATPHRFWERIADVGIVATWITGLAVFALLLYNFSLYFTAPEVVSRAETSPQFLLGLPGINPLIPLWYGLAALLVALVVHEGAHGVLAYAGRMKVKSLGLLFFVIPVGAFVEPDEEDMERATTRQKNRVFAAGPWSNLLLALVAGLLLSQVFMASLVPVNDGMGVGIAGIVVGNPAEAAGLETGDLLIALGNVTGQERGPKLSRLVLRDSGHYTEVMNRTVAGQIVTVEYLRNGDVHTARVALTDRYEAIRANSPTLPESEIPTWLKGKGFMGIIPLQAPVVSRIADIIEHPFGDGLGSFYPGSPTGAPPGSFMLYVGYPFLVFFTGLDVFSPPYRQYFDVEGPLSVLPVPVFFGIATFLYWLVWINLMLGTFNALPAGPLDGGQMFRATVRERLMRRFGVNRDNVAVERHALGGMQLKGRDPETQEKLDRVDGLTSRATRSLGFFILGLILLQLVGPRLLRLIL